MGRLTPLIVAAIVVACGADESDSHTTPLRVAVAGNFAAPHARLAELFRAATGVEVETSLGATGSLYAQIVNGAPYDIFLAADDERPARLEEEGRAIRGSRITYALGRIALYAPGWDTVSGGDDPRLAAVQSFAIANPKTAPYGVAASQALRHWGLWNDLEDRVVRGENVGQAFQFVASAGADAGIVALSQVIGRDPNTYWIIPEDLHAPIRQEGVILTTAGSKADARAFMDFIQGDEARRVIVEFGYRTP